ncbi:hypothetical protein BC938DRAFT_483210 [Jimgerdemannia flammicorona]|uniref:Restriction endonuclease domain-containing protein n=1 Tax=Jimgerdemannia flammicorona TaxID=994334 RepID=A0A433QVZ7_9FUNG|nr:hypothetical protein BC938DRAFT_483210 [Jimgerdemannia flammicorona]
MHKTSLRLPKEPVTVDRLPLRIGTNVSVERYNTFVVLREAPGYKFKLNADGDVYIVDMADSEHEAVISSLQAVFRVANGGVLWNPPIRVWGQPYHNAPGGGGLLVAPDVAVSPSNVQVQVPIMPYPGPPPGNSQNYPYARIVCEVAIHQSTQDWEARCRNWLQEPYIRFVLGIKVHEKRIVRNPQGQYHRSMTARLWQQGAPAPGFTMWDFGTLAKHSHIPTGCNAVGVPGFQIQIPTNEIFWDPPIVAGVPNLFGYVAVTPPAVAPIIVIDLYRIQQEILTTQCNE